MWRVLIIGCGNIAGGFDAQRAADLPPLTHAGAYRQHGGFELVACVEPDALRRAAFVARWGVARGFADVGSAAAAGPFDVISLCTPTAWHGAHMLQLLALRPRMVFCEKPLTPTLAESAELVRRCTEQGVALAVNHNRRWAPDVWRWAEELAAGEWGVLRSAVGTYNKGVLNNGGHMLDLMQMLLGPLTLHSAGRAVADFWADDPTVPALLHTRSGAPVQLSVGHAADCAVFELQLLTSEASITMEDGGQRWRVRRVVDSVQFAGYRVLDSGHSQPGQYTAATLAAVTNLHDALQLGAPLLSTGENALQAQALCEQIRAAALPPLLTLSTVLS